VTFVNLPLRYIEERPRYLELFLSRRLNPELGFDAWALDGYGTRWHVRTASLFREAGLTCAVHLPFFDLHPGSLDPMIRETTRGRLLQAVETALAYGPAHFIAHLDYNPLVYSLHQERWLENSVRTWSDVLDRAAGVPVFLENVHELEPKWHTAVLEALGGRAGACLDVGHWHSFGRGRDRNNLQEWLRALDPFLGHLHLHDNDGSGDQHLGLGRGSIPWETLWAFLGKRKAPVTATFEPHTEEDFLATEAYMASRIPLPG